MARAPMTWLVIPFKLVLNGQKSIRAGDSTVLLAVPVASAGRLRVGGIQEKIDFLNPQPNCRFGASMLLWRRY
jgi:hypothetical protein